MGSGQSSNLRNSTLGQTNRTDNGLANYSVIRNNTASQRSNRQQPETTSTSTPGTARLLVEGPLKTSTQIPVYFKKTKPITLNLRKETLKVKPFQDDPNILLVEFIFDATVAGYITVYYFAKQVLPQEFTKFEGKYEKYPGKTSFQPGSNQFYQQKPTKGLKVQGIRKEDLFYDGGVYFPLVIVLETRFESSNCSPASLSSGKVKDSPPYDATAQLTFATFVKNSNNSLSLTCLKQQMIIDGDLYLLEDIFGLEEEESDTGSSQACLICMLHSVNALLLPCRHLCLCIECAERMRVRSSCCPLCRHPVAQILQIYSPFLRVKPH